MGNTDILWILCDEKTTLKQYTHTQRLIEMVSPKNSCWLHIYEILRIIILPVDISDTELGEFSELLISIDVCSIRTSFHKVRWLMDPCMKNDRSL